MVKIGGLKAYENYGVHVAWGFFLGCVLAMLMAGGMSFIRFFIPF